MDPEVYPESFSGLVSQHWFSTTQTVRTSAWETHRNEPRLHDGPGGLPRILFGASVSALVFHHPDCAYFGVGDVEASN
jgi:hypothetical protein